MSALKYSPKWLRIKFSIATKVISPTQTTFLPVRNIMEGVIVLYESIHEMYRKKQNGLIFKIDFEKAYDKINWSFVHKL
jgi:hypothetical protein